MKPSRMSHLLVGLQFAGILLCCLPLETPNHLQSAWVPLGFGTLLALWTLLHNRIGNFGIYPEPKSGSRLVTSGPYQYVRHPMYLALVLCMLGVVLYIGGWNNTLGFLILLSALSGKMHHEERYLAERFPEYAEYAARTPRLIPFVL